MRYKARVRNFAYFPLNFSTLFPFREGVFPIGDLEDPSYRNKFRKYFEDYKLTIKETRPKDWEKWEFRQKTLKTAHSSFIAIEVRRKTSYILKNSIDSTLGES